MKIPPPDAMKGVMQCPGKKPGVAKPDIDKAGINRSKTPPLDARGGVTQ